MDQSIPLMSLLMALRSNGRDSLAALRGDFDPIAALQSPPFTMPRQGSLAALLTANPQLRQQALSAVQGGSYLSDVQ